MTKVILPDGSEVEPLSTEAQGKIHWEKSERGQDWLAEMAARRKEPQPEKKPRGHTPLSYTKMANRARESGKIPLSDELLQELLQALGKLSIGTHCELVYLAGPTQRALARSGELVSFTEKEAILLGDSGTFYTIPLNMVFHGTYSMDNQGGTST